MTFAVDPTGGSFGFWQAGKHVGASIGAELVDESDALIWNDLETADRQAANAFYSAVFGWTQEPFGDAYDIQKVGDSAIGGIGDGGASITSTLRLAMPMRSPRRASSSAARS